MEKLVEFPYEMKKKKVKHISIRVTVDGKVTVWVPMCVSMEKAKEFVYAKRHWISSHLKQMKKKEMIYLHELNWDAKKEKELLQLVLKQWEAFAFLQIPYPIVKFRIMKGSWGICRKTRGIITLNKALYVVPKECQEYVITHELSHLIQANHSKEFYKVLAQVMPNYKEYEERLKTYAIQD